MVELSLPQAWIAALCTLCPSLGAEAPEEQWELLWERLVAFEQAPDPDTGRQWRERLEELQAALPEDPRVALLGARLQRAGVEGAQPARRLIDLLPQDAPWPLDTDATWLALDVLPPGPVRVGATLLALEASEGELPYPRLYAAWNVAVEEGTALRLEEGTLPIQRNLHERYQAPWSAVDLALTLGWLDRSEEADELLARTLEQERAAGRPTADLSARRGLLALGAGDEPRARDALGRALAGGSIDAAMILAKLDLDAGDTLAARRGFRALLSPDPAPAWALRGWGLALLAGSDPAPSENTTDPN